MESGKHNAFTCGCTQFKKDLQKTNVLSVDHCVAVVAKAGRKEMQVSLAATHRSHEKAVTAVLHLVYFMAKKNLPSDSFSDLKQRLIVQVCVVHL